MGMIFFVSFIPPAFYFDKKQSLAMGIVSAGGGMSTLFFPLLSEWLIDVYNWRGALLITSGLLLNCLPCYILISPVNERKKLLPQKGMLTDCDQHHGSASTNIVKLKYWVDGNSKDDVTVKGQYLSDDFLKSENRHNDQHENISNEEISDTVEEFMKKLQNQTSPGDQIIANKFSCSKEPIAESSRSICVHSASVSPQWKKPSHEKWQKFLDYIDITFLWNPVFMIYIVIYSLTTAGILAK